MKLIFPEKLKNGLSAPLKAIEKLHPAEIFHKDRPDPDELSGQELIDLLSEGKISLLKHLDAKALHDEMRTTGFSCCMFLDRICAEKDDAKLRERAADLLQTAAPAAALADFPEFDGCIVIGFNHPSLGEIFRLLLLSLKNYPDKDFLFPVNLPWYENIAPHNEQLKRLGITIVPMITPSTERKLKKTAAGDEEKLEKIRKYKTLFERRYMKTAREFAERNSVIFVAPSATRQATVFADEIAARGEGHIHPTMTLLAHMVLGRENDRVLFLPVTVFEPQNGTRMLNPLREYGIYPCEPFSAEEVRNLTSGREREFDYRFLKRIDTAYHRRADLYELRKRH